MPIVADRCKPPPPLPRTWGPAPPSLPRLLPHYAPLANIFNYSPWPSTAFGALLVAQQHSREPAPSYSAATHLCGARRWSGRRQPPFPLPPPSHPPHPRQPLPPLLQVHIASHCRPAGCVPLSLCLCVCGVCVWRVRVLSASAPLRPSLSNDETGNTQMLLELI